MRRTIPVMLALCFLFAIHAPVVAEDDLTTAEKTWLEGVTSAGWSSSSGTDEVSISARNAPMMDDCLKTVLAKTAKLSSKQQAALHEGVRIEVKQPGWIKGVEVVPGTYTVGFRQGGHSLETVIRDPDGNIVNVGGMNLDEGTTNKPQTLCTASHGVANLTAAWGDVAFHWTYVGAKKHTDTLGACTEHRAGRVSVFSDLPEEAHVGQVAKLADKAVAANETLMGVKLPEDFRYRIYLLGTLEAYRDIDDLLTGGDFKRNGAFTAQLTGLSYLWYYTHFGENYALSSSLLEVIIHELHHQYIYHALPSLAYAPTWFQEACAEVAAQQGLELADKTAAANYRKRRLAELLFCTRAGQMPNAEDMRSDLTIDSVTAYYTAAWVIGGGLAAKPDDLKQTAGAMAERQTYWDIQQVLWREFDARYPAIDQMLDDGLQQARKAPAGWIKNNCCVDDHNGVSEINSEIGVGGFALINQPIMSDAFKLSGEFRWDDATDKQVDFLFTYGAGAKAEHFMKIALLPAKAVLFKNDNDDWTTMATLTWETDLPAADEDGKPIWHAFTLTFDANTQIARLDLPDGRYAKFTLNDYYSVRGTYAGLGVFNGVAWYRNLKLE